MYSCINQLRTGLLDVLQGNINNEICYAVIRYIDQYIEAEFADDCIEDNLSDEYESLNEQYTDTVRILPVMVNTGIHTFSKMETDGSHELLRKRYPSDRDLLTQKIQNYIILEEDFINTKKVVVHRIRETGSVGRRFLNRQKLSCVLFPVTCHHLERYFLVDYQKEKFNITGYTEDVKELKNTYAHMIQKCKEASDIDFVVFPEMLMTEEILEIIKKESNIAAFVCNGTIWNNHKNVCHVTDADGNQIFSYDKKSTFEFGRDGKIYTEGLEYDSKNEKEEYDFIDIEGIGRVSVCICKDIMHTDLLYVHEKMHTDVLIVPAFSPSLDVKSKAQSFSEEHQCIVLFANSCGAFYDKQKSMEQNRKDLKKGEVGFVVLPAKDKSSERTYNLLSYSAGQCMEMCTLDNCVGRRVDIDFKKNMESDGKTTISCRVDLF